MTDDDDLRFGDVSGSGGNGSAPDDLIDTLVRVFQLIILLYIILVVVQMFIGVDIPFVSGPVGI